MALPVYVGKILNGAKLSELPVVKQTKLTLAIDLKAAKTLGLDLSATLFVRADEVIEQCRLFPKMTNAISCNPALPGDPAPWYEHDQAKLSP